MHDERHFLKQNAVLSLNFSISLFFHLLLLEVLAQMCRPVWFTVVNGALDSVQFAAMNLLALLVVLGISVLVESRDSFASTVHGCSVSTASFVSGVCVKKK